jgi:maltokinase
VNVKEISESALVRERWYAGKGRRLATAAVVDVVAVPGSRAALGVAEFRYEDGGSERYLLIEGRPDWPAVLRGCPLEGAHGRLELRPGPALERLLPGSGAAVWEPSSDQSNTLLVAGELLIKLYRRVQAGVHPEVEVLGALAGTPAPVPEYGGSLWYVDDHAQSAVALLQDFIPGAESGWEGPIERAAAWLRAPGSTAAVEAEHRRLGGCAAGLRDGLAVALGRVPAPPDIGALWHEEALAVLAAAAVLDETARDPRIASRLDALAEAQPGELARVHGDLHVAQVLRVGDAIWVIDFEGDPTLPLAARRRPDTPLRDLACLLRSVDHVGQAAARRVPGAAEAAKETWIRAASGAVLEGWGESVPSCLLHALELAKACQELVYASRVVPEWAYAPRAGLGRLLAEGDA